MDTAYWIFEYIKVLLSYLFLMFLWPKVVFGRHLRGRPKRYQFCFCAGVQIILVNTVVLALGMLHILNEWTVRLVFYGLFLFAVFRRLGLNADTLEQAYRAARVSSLKSVVYRLRGFFLKKLQWLWALARPHFWELLLLFILLTYGIAYFSWGAFQYPSYGFGDLYVHHSWIYGLTQGKIFSGGIYPEAMHCFIYSQYALCGVPVYSILVFLGSIHTAVFLLTVYCLLRELFRWRYTPIFALTLFLILNVKSGYGLSGMSRLQWALPQEFGLVPQFLCAFFLMRYLKSSYHGIKRGRLAKYCCNKELLLFAVSLASVIATHFYAAIMAFFLCVPFAIFGLRRLFTRERFLPLVAAALCGLFISVAPMAAAFASGTPFEGSLNWAMAVMNGEDPESVEEQKPEQVGESAESEKRSFLGDAANKLFGWMDTLRRKGYAVLYGVKRGDLLIGLTVFGLFLCIALRLVLWRLPAKAEGRIKIQKAGLDTACFEGYLPLIFASVLYMMLYAAPDLGVPELVEGVRLCSTEHMLLLAVAVIPLDMLFAFCSVLGKERALQVCSCLFPAAIYLLAVGTGNYHEYLYFELTRYNAEVMVMNAIDENFEPESYTIVSPTDGLYPNIMSGWHEELLTFVENTYDVEYTIPSEYVFIFIEKKPLYYAQTHFFQGPSWLAWDGTVQGENVSRGSEILASEISLEAAEKDLMEFSKPFDSYKNLESRTIVESKAYAWCRRFSQLYPQEMKIYYEDEDFACYYFRQEKNSPYKLGLNYGVE